MRRALDGRHDAGERPALDVSKLAANSKVVSWSDWETIDREERLRGQRKNKLREKFTDVGDMLRLLS